MPVYCDKCLGYVTDKLSFPPHAHEPIMQVLKFKNLIKYAHVLAHFILEWITLCENTEVVHIVETAKMRMTIQHAEIICKSNSNGVEFIQQHPQLYSEYIMRELESQVLGFKKEVWQVIWLMAEYNIVRAQKDVDGHFLHWFVQHFIGFWSELPAIHNEHCRLHKPSEPKTVLKKVTRPQSAAAIRPIIIPNISRVRTYESPFKPLVHSQSIVVKKDTYIENIEDLYL